MYHSKLAVLSLCVLGCAFFLATQSALAHDGSIGSAGTPVELSDWNTQSYQHPDQDPWKGWLFIYTKNTSDEDWGDFHVEIYDYAGVDISNVDFIVDSPYEPVSSQTGLTWSVDNSVVGATLDLYFYGDPVGPGEIVTFEVYTDNTTDHNNFGVMIHPTPVPEPATLALLLFGGLALLRRRR